jgi:predicted metal-dependent phosphoesterase TrpH
MVRTETEGTGKAAKPVTGERLRVDMHLHTYRSHDCLLRPRGILEVARVRGLDRLVVTDHNEIRGALELREMDPERIIVGEEVKTREGPDIIGIFLSEVIPKRTSARETCERIRAQGGVVYLPHPFDTSRSGGLPMLEDLVDLIDIVEVHNARCWPISLNGRALSWAREKGKLMGAGSDAHTLAELGRGYIDVPPFEPNRESFLAAVGAGEVAGMISSSPVYRLASTWAKLRKKIPLPGGGVDGR